MIVLKALSGSSSSHFSGIVKVDENYQRESRKGSREWARHKKSPHLWPKPPHLRWSEYHCNGIKMKRDLSACQLSILKMVNRSGSNFLKLIPNTKHPTIAKNLTSAILPDSILLSDTTPAYSVF
jgi:hypothetical protein